MTEPAIVTAAVGAGASAVVKRAGAAVLPPLMTTMQEVPMLMTAPLIVAGRPPTERVVMPITAVPGETPG